MPRPCLICSSSAKSAEAAKLIALGNSDQAVADALNRLDPSSPPMSAMAASRHRRMHVLKVAQDQIALVSKGSAARQEREQLATAAAADTPSTEAIVAAAIGLQAQVKELAAIEDRLERMATIAEAGGSPTGVAVLAAQALRGIETGAKLAGIGGFAPARAADQAAGNKPFSVNIIFGNGRVETIAPVFEVARTVEAELPPED